MVGEKIECKSMIPNTYTISSCLHKFNGNNKPIKMSGKLLLLLAVLPKLNTKMSSEKVWSKEDYVMVKLCKPSIMDSLHHHGSTGNYYAFGNKANYAMVNKSSVGLYSNKKSKIQLSNKRLIGKQMLLRY